MSDGLAQESLRVAEEGFEEPIGDIDAQTQLGIARARAFVQLGRYEDAVQSLDEIGDTVQRKEVTVVRAAAQVAAGNPENALATLDFHSGTPATAEAELWRAVALLLLGRQQEASEACDAATGLDATHPATLLLKAQALIEMATSAGSSAVRTGIEEGRRLLVMVVEDSPKSGMATPFFEVQRTARRDEPSFQHIEAELIYARHEDPRQLLVGIDLFQTPTELNAAVAWLRAEAAESACAPQEAAEAFEDASRLYDYIDSGLAVELLQRASRLADPEGFRSLRVADKLLQVYYEAGTQEAPLETALEWYRRWVAAGPSSAPSWACSLRGQIAREQADFLHAGIQEELWKAVAVTEAGGPAGPRDDYRWVHLCLSYAALDLNSAGLQAAEAAFELNEDDPWVRFQFLLALFNHGSYARGKELLPTIVDDPTYGSFSRALGSLLRLMTSTGPEIVAEIEQRDGALSDESLDWLHAEVVLRHRGLGAARPLLEQVVERLSGKGTRTTQLALMKAFLGDLEEARQLLDEGERLGNVYSHETTMVRSVIALLDGDVEIGARLFHDWVAVQTNVGDLSYALAIRLPSLSAVSKRPGIGTVVNQLIDDGHVRRLLLQSEPPPWIVDVELAAGGQWYNVARVLARRRFGKVPGPAELREVKEVLATELPSALVGTL